MSSLLFYIFGGLALVFGFVFMTDDKSKEFSSLLSLFMLAIAGIFLLYDHFFIWIVYLVMASAFLFMIYLYRVHLSKKVFIQRNSFVKQLVYMVTILNFLFILFVAIFSGKTHMLWPRFNWINEIAMQESLPLLLSMLIVAFIISGIGVVASLKSRE